MPEFSVITGPQVAQVLDGREARVVDLVREAYLAHHDGDSVNPDSYFLRFPQKPEARIIALPAYLGGKAGVAGIKWIASFPHNVRSGLQRASAVLVLNDFETGFPLALLESAAISAARTAASAALAAAALGPDTVRRVGVVGAGPIARTVCRYLAATRGGLPEVRCHDLDAASADRLVDHLRRTHGGDARTGTLSDALDCDLVVLATTAPAPYIHAPEHALRAGQLVLNLSLRDLAPELLLGADNVLDDVEHCLKAATSPHLAEQLTGGRDFVTGTLAGVLRGEVRLDAGRPTVFSPFGLGVLDLAVGHHVYRAAAEDGLLLTLPDFFGDTAR
ncbi:2,3-diaminopropionate biosynthesis protein SbnB [Streptomyces virens]|uniref:2,3-diaminopropionate biosynthesis protein SbnB n=1 Tax=Streptomyces virens TaxID=285572 RepID=A0ABP6PJK2_9ACTN|nr:2,3-diaminopropionate biosynthesis protein SbnB [Streptomyces calvus]MBA8979612.1 ornithine cyclodeaminase [Streptomyces calvus]